MDDGSTRDAETAERETIGEDTTDERGGRVAAPPAAHAPERYRMGDPIGRGGMGIVVAARDEQIGREVAIKLLRADHPTERQIHRFLREAKIQGRLEHPAIVPVHEIGSGRDGRPFFAMKKLAGTTLAQIIAADDASKHPRQRLLRAFADVCLAVELAHTRGVIHRDLKPENIVLGDFGEVYVLDWGVAKVTGEDDRDLGRSSASDLGTRAGVAIGTPGYMAPEQARGEPDIDARVDVYALGCVLFEILAGERLHAKGAVAMSDAFPLDGRPSQRAPGRAVPPELDAVCASAIVADRDGRIATARELGERVQRYLDGDRDLALRRTLARQHLQVAVAAFGAREDAEARRTAIRDAGAALALDPELRGAAELVSRLMLEPPREMPRPVRDAIAAADAASGRNAGRVASLWYLFYVAFALCWLALSPAHWREVVVIAALALFSSALARQIGSGRFHSTTPLFALMNLLLIGAFAHCASPFLVAPGLAASTACAHMLTPAAARWRDAALMIAAMIAAVLGPWLLETFGVLSATTEFGAGGMSLHAALFSPSATVSAALLVGGTVMLIAGAPMFVFLARRNDAAVQHRLQLQTWQLSQLVPEAAS